MRGAALLVCAGALAATVRGPPALEGALMQPAEDGDGPQQWCVCPLLSPEGLLPPTNCLIATMRCWPQAGFAFQHWLLPWWWTSDDPPTPEKGGTLLENEEMASNSPTKFVPG